MVQYVLIGANATSPNITTENVYLENNVGWAGKGVAAASTNTTADFSATTPTPFQGSECANLDIGRYSSGRGVFFATGSPVSRSEYTVLSMRVYLTEDLTSTSGYPATRRPIVRAWNNNTKDIGVGYIYLDMWGLDYSLLNTWQLVSMPTGMMTANQGTANTIGYLLLGLVGYNDNSQPANNIVVDDVKLQTGFGPSSSVSTIDVYNEGTIVADASKLNFKSNNGGDNRIEENSTTGELDIEINLPGQSEESTFSSSLTFNCENLTLVAATAQDQDLTISNPTGTPVNGQKVIIRIKDDGTARSLTWSSVFIPIGVTLPTTTTPNKLLYVGCIYNNDSSKWDVIAVKEEA